MLLPVGFSLETTLHQHERTPPAFVVQLTCFLNIPPLQSVHQFLRRLSAQMDQAYFLCQGRFRCSPETHKFTCLSCQCIPGPVFSSFKITLNSRLTFVSMVSYYFSFTLIRILNLKIRCCSPALLCCHDRYPSSDLSLEKS